MNNRRRKPTNVLPVPGDPDLNAKIFNTIVGIMTSRKSRAFDLTQLAEQARSQAGPRKQCNADTKR
jgi:hypothetical protein